ncbi:MerR family transcriptional regulator [Paenibacillus hexagrammi]|uniref:MerR family transcriptional regulator n=1 Tax=Paenibacillus hexagrammi TaxID=2908839 RepID=A0ABY3SEX3_9BACL|nr:MerR family transcriptional regulator [Paenibacillus sp. YPD9-1]UJF32538.1 MerR family transcriptional regulator [Paenibacillus sp. YPD9-1]
MTFTIKETAIQTGLSEDTIRYYEKIGLLPRAERKQNKHRVYHAEDIETMRIVTCLKKTGMSLDSMKPILQLSQDGNLGEYSELTPLLQEHKKKIEQQISSLQQIVDFIDGQLKAGHTGGNKEECTLVEPVRKSPLVQRR